MVHSGSLFKAEAVQKVLSVMLNEVKHPFFRTNKWILQSLRSFRMTFSLFWDNLARMGSGF